MDMKSFDISFGEGSVTINGSEVGCEQAIHIIEGLSSMKTVTGVTLANKGGE